MKQPHKHSALIKAWADGFDIQCRKNATYDWVDIIGGTPAWSSDWEYRIKPKTIKYRNFLWQPKYLGSKICVSVCTEQAHKCEPRDNWTGFIKWLGDWQEVEV